MRQIIFAGLFALAAASCQTSRNAVRDRAEIVVEEDPHKVDFSSLKGQKIYSFDERASLQKEGNRGLVTMMAGSLVSLATNAVKNVIKKDKSKYTAAYTCGQQDLYFYDQLSTESPFDPVGMKFSGFTLLRSVPGKETEGDTSLMVRFSIDNSNLYEVLNNGTFRLRLDELDLRVPRAKVEKKGPQTLHMDIEIKFTTSYITEQGTLVDDATLGTFHLFLRNAPVNREDPGYQAYYDKLKGRILEGRSFIVPRSAGYYIKPDGSTGRSFSQGQYAIAVSVKEATRQSFVTRLLINNSDRLLETAGSRIKGLAVQAEKQGPKK